MSEEEKTPQEEPPKSSGKVKSIDILMGVPNQDEEEKEKQKYSTVVTLREGISYFTCLSILYEDNINSVGLFNMKIVHDSNIPGENIQLHRSLLQAHVVNLKQITQAAAMKTKPNAGGIITPGSPQYRNKFGPPPRKKRGRGR